MIDGLVDEGTLETVALAPEPVAKRPDPDHVAHRCRRTSAGRDGLAAAVATTALRKPERSPRAVAGAAGKAPVTLLEGVTGSGKTEVYFEAVAAALRQDGRA